MTIKLDNPPAGFTPIKISKFSDSLCFSFRKQSTWFECAVQHVGDKVDHNSLVVKYKNAVSDGWKFASDAPESLWEYMYRLKNFIIKENK